MSKLIGTAETQHTAQFHAAQFQHRYSSSWTFLMHAVRNTSITTTIKVKTYNLQAATRNKKKQKSNLQHTYVTIAIKVTRK